MFVGRLYLIYLIFNLFILNKIKGNDHEVDFQEIEISIFQEIEIIEKSIRSSKPAFFKIDQEIEKAQ
jgi:hypothetical protein